MRERIHKVSFVKNWLRKTTFRTSPFVFCLSSFRLTTFIFALILFGCRNPEIGAPPLVLITYPADGAFVKDTVIIKALTIDNIEIKKIEFYIDGELFGEDATSPYTCAWFTGGLIGPHTILAKAWDNYGNCGLSNLVNVYIIDTTDTEPPQIGITSPADGAWVRGTIEILTEVSDNKGVDRVSFLIDGNLVFTDFTAPFTCVWNTGTIPNGSHTVLAKAFDYNENWANYMITVIVMNTIVLNK